MKTTLISFIFIAISVRAQNPNNGSSHQGQSPSNPGTPKLGPLLTLPQRDGNNEESRKTQIEQTRQGLQYGPDIAGGGPFYPTGPLAKERIDNMTDEFFAEQIPWRDKVDNESKEAEAKISANGGIKTFDDYQKLYQGTFPESLPDGVSEGMLSNGTSDLLFAMERLSIQPFSLRRVGKDELLSFSVKEEEAKKLSTMTHEGLKNAGRLFYIDYRDLADQKLIDGRYAGACDAYFYIHPKSDQFLPLAIRPNNGSPLIYTPLDDENDWTLAKLLFNQNDFWWGQWYHLVATHEVIDLVYLAAERTLSTEHPIHALLTRLAYQTYAFRVAAKLTLFNKGGAVDTYFAWPGSNASEYTAKLYKPTAGLWRSNYFRTRLARNGLLHSKAGPPIKHFPFLEDATVIVDAIEQFVTEFVHSYYTDPDGSGAKSIKEDYELQGFVKELTGPAQVIDFEPKTLSSARDLIAVLTHFAYLVSVEHGVLNANDPVHTTAALPMHPMSLYRSLPAEKGAVKDLAPFMPSLEKSLGQVALLAGFNRPFFKGGNRTLAEMFDDRVMLPRTNQRTRDAAAAFRRSMEKFSGVVSGRRFDDRGLSQGMPFIWKVLDPQTTPFYLTV